ncbi:hypothetical protein V498_08626 [Pseudogymnoascus sp. VKM F-4517 (FW-2822)]|nr:hypothetical protein V498_08626 [Pseudogymnoascus sp. VKM F-4517 (FW-2822)]
MPSDEASLKETCPLRKNRRVFKLGVLDGRPPASDKKRPSTKQLCATEGGTHLYVIARIQKQHLRVMIDSGATGNFMTKKVANERGFGTQLKANPCLLLVVDREPISTNGGMVTHETVPLVMTMLHGHKETIQFDIVHMDNHACILGVPWLKKHNPRIDWKDETVELSQCACKQRTGTPRRRKSLQGRREASLPTSILVEYKEYEQLFREGPKNEALPKHQP